MIVHKNVLNSFLVNNCRLGRVDTSPPSLIFNNNNMALQVWLPLTKDLSNQGLNNMTFSSDAGSNIILDNNGKIGKCYFRPSKQTSGKITSNSTINLSEDISMACWALVSDCVGNTANGLISNHSNVDKTGVGITVKQISTSDYRISCSTGTGSDRTFYTYYGTTNIKDAWHHLALTYSKSAEQLILYVDGNAEYTLNNYINSSIEDYIKIFEWSTTYDSGMYRPAAKLNDVRIYDHCLSPKEVKEISKGLVLHYPLNSIINNNILLNSAAYNGTTNWSGEVSVDPTGFYGTPCFVAKRTNTTSTSRTFVTHPSILNQVSSWTPGTKFTISGWYYIVSSDFNVTANPFIRWQNSSNMVDTGFNITASDKKDTWVRFEKTFSVPDAFKSNPFTSVTFYMAAFSAGGTSTIKFSQLKLELGDVATAWCPNSEESFYTHLKPSNIIHDCSGYQNNGTISGSLSCRDDSPRYKTSTISIDESSFSKILCSNLNLPNGQTTLSFWSKPTNKNEEDSSKIEITYSKNKYFTYINFPYFIHDGDYKYKWKNYWSDGNWHFVTCLFDGTNTKIYIDGNDISPSTDSSTSVAKTQLDDLTLLIRGNSLSDFRVYATALSEEDIKELYDTSAYILDNGTLLTYSVEE